MTPVYCQASYRVVGVVGVLSVHLIRGRMIAVRPLRDERKAERLAAIPSAGIPGAAVTSDVMDVGAVVGPGHGLPHVDCQWVGRESILLGEGDLRRRQRCCRWHSCRSDGRNRRWSGWWWWLLTWKQRRVEPRFESSSRVNPGHVAVGKGRPTVSLPPDHETLGSELVGIAIGDGSLVLNAVANVRGVHVV